VTPPPFDPQSFLQLARDLSASHGDDEAYRRTAVSRAYYGCFHLARRGLERGGRWAAGTVNAHERVIQELRSRRRDGLANSLRALRRVREYADYDLQTPFTPIITSEALAIAETLGKLLETF
jgi:hypothetical protein